MTNICQGQGSKTSHRDVDQSQAIGTSIKVKPLGHRSKSSHWVENLRQAIHVGFFIKMLILGFSLFKSIIKFEKSVIFGICPTLGHTGLYGGNLCMTLSQFWYACMCIGLIMGYMYRFWLYSMVFSPYIMNLPYVYAIFDIYINPN